MISQSEKKDSRHAEEEEADKEVEKEVEKDVEEGVENKAEEKQSLVMIEVKKIQENILINQK